jgi:hypothetical protein
VRYARYQLFEDAGEPGLLELTQRGLLASTLVEWGIGYNPKWIADRPENWGLPRNGKKHRLWLPRGIVIPCFVGDVLWYLKVRVFADDGLPVTKESGRAKYLQPAGGRHALFGADRLRGEGGLLLAESELDALLAWQEGGDLLDVTTLGGAGKRLGSRWLPYLLTYRKIFVAYDMDTAGQRGSQRLTALSERMVSWPPPFGDISDFYQAGGNLRGMMEEMAVSMWD